MIQVICPSCQAKLNAKASIIGQERKCPKCGQPVRIERVPEDDPVVDLGAPSNGQSAERDSEASADDGLPVFRPPRRLQRDSHYLIVDKTQLVAAWENNGKGWMLRTGQGWTSAKRNRESLPTHGEFQLVELKFTKTDEGKKLTGIEAFQLASHWALTALDQGDDPISEKITGHGRLNRDQKSAVRLSLRELFMRPVWENASTVLDYLANTDYHTTGVG